MPTYVVRAAPVELHIAGDVDGAGARTYYVEHAQHTRRRRVRCERGGGAYSRSSHPEAIWRLISRDGDDDGGGGRGLVVMA